MQRGGASLSYLVLFPRNIRLLPRAISRHFRGFNIGLAGRGSKSRQTCMVSQMLQNSTIPHLIFMLNKDTFLLHIMCGYQCDKAVNKNDTREVT